MKLKLYFSIIWVSLFFSVCEKLNAQAPGFLLAKEIGSFDMDEGMSITFDALGNTYTTGKFRGIVDFDPGGGVFNLTANGMDDIFICKLDASGNFVWAKSIGSSLNKCAGYSIAIDGSSNAYIIGRFEGTIDFNPGAGILNLTSAGLEDIFILKLDAAGNFVWVKRIGGPVNDGVFSLALDISGNIYYTSTFALTVDFNPGPGVYYLTSTGLGFNICISKLDSSGNFIWAKQIGGLIGIMSMSISTDLVGNIYSTGIFSGDCDFDPDSAGIFNLTSSGGGDIFISKLDNSGNFLWARSMGGPTDDYGYDIVSDVSGNVYTTGKFTGVCDFDPGIGTFNLISQGDKDIFISKLDNSGNFIWAKQIGGIDEDVGESTTVDILGNVYSSGVFSGVVDFNPDSITNFNLTSTGGKDIFISKLNSSGNFVWAKSIGGMADDHAYSMSADLSGNIFLTGSFSGPSAYFDPFTLSCTGARDIFIAKLGVINTGVETLTSNDNISIYPNPATNQLHISLTKSITSNATLTITDMQGRIVKEMLITPAGDAIDVSTLSQGVYLLRMDGVVRRFVKL